MEKSKALIVEHTNKPSNLCHAAARISTTKGSAMEIFEQSMEKEDTSLISKVLGMGHHSVSEHVFFTIVFDNVSVIVEQFLIEFRLASYTVKSRRYVDYKGMGWVIPEFSFKDEFKGEKDDLLDEYNKGMDELFAAYSKLTDRDIPREDARFILPYSFRSNFYCTVNSRELMKMIYSACYGRGSKYPEIKKLGEMLLDQAKSIFSEPFELVEKIAAFKDDIPEYIRDLTGDLKNDSLPENKAELISSTENATFKMAVSQIVAESGIPTDQAEEFLKNNKKAYSELIDKVIIDGRPRALESMNFGFRINRITLAGLTHLVRHRIQSIIIPPLANGIRFNDFIIPETIKNDDKSLEIYMEAYEKHLKLHEKFSAVLENKEDLVYFALAGMRLDVVTTMNARELFHYFRLRTCMRAQWEIREISNEMLKILREKEPDIFNKVGPGCFMDKVCPEGKYTCGKFKEVREFMTKL